MCKTHSISCFFLLLVLFCIFGFPKQWKHKYFCIYSLQPKNLIWIFLLSSPLLQQLKKKKSVYYYFFFFVLFIIFFIFQVFFFFQFFNLFSSYLSSPIWLVFFFGFLLFLFSWWMRDNACFLRYQESDKQFWKADWRNFWDSNYNFQYFLFWIPIVLQKWKAIKDIDIHLLLNSKSIWFE